MAPPTVPYVATVTASAELPAHPAGDALSTDDKVAWCAPADAPATLTIAFDRPVEVGKVSVEVAEVAEAWSAGDFAVVTDTASVPAHLELAAGRVNVALSGAPTRTLALKLAAQPGLPRMCVTGVVPRAKDDAPVPLLVGVPPAAAAALPEAVTQLDAALKRCDAKEIAAAFAFPVAMTMHFDVRPADLGRGKKTAITRYSSARQLANACANDGRLIALGFSAAYAAELTSVMPTGPGRIRLGERELGWNLAWKAGWKVTSFDLHDPTYRSDGWGDEPGPVQLWLSSLRGGGGGAPDTEDTAPDALFVGVDAKDAVLARDVFAASAQPSEDSSLERVTTARAKGASWMVMVAPGGHGELRVSALSALVGDKSEVIAAFVSSPHAGKAAAMAPLPPLTRDRTLTATPDVLAAVTRLVTGPLDAVAASRPDLVAIGGRAGETTIGGDKLAPVWRARWANQLTITGVVGRVAPEGRAAFVVVDATKAKAAYRIAMVLDRTASGGWSLAHLHIATP